MLKMKRALLVLGFIKGLTTITQIGIVNIVGIITRAVAHKFAALMVIDGNTDFIEIVRPIIIITDIETITATALAGGGGIVPGVPGEDIIIHTRIHVEAPVMVGITTIGEPCHVTDTLVHRRRVHHHLVRIPAFPKFQLLINL
tara:strand:+ start:185 stop:613 length:429 start_codon:yes stop_codon:yes gene_type:complete